MNVFMTESTEQKQWVKEFYSASFCIEACYFWGQITEEYTKYDWLAASKIMGYDISFLDDGKSVCIKVPTNDIKIVEY